MSSGGATPPPSGPGWGWQAPAGATRAKPVASAGWLLPLLLAIALAAAFLVVDRSGGEGAEPHGPVSQAADRMLTRESFKFRSSGLATGTNLPAGGLKVSSSGVFEGPAHRGLLTFTQTVGGRTSGGESILDGPASYLRTTGESAFSPGWTVSRDSNGSGPAIFTGANDPVALLGQVDATTGMFRVGQERIGQILTDHFTGTLDPEKEAERLRSRGLDDSAKAVGDATDSGTVDAWIDRAGRILQFRIVLSLNGGAVSDTTTVDYFDFGASAQVHDPPVTTAP